MEVLRLTSQTELQDGLHRFMNAHQCACLRLMRMNHFTGMLCMNCDQQCLVDSRQMQRHHMQWQYLDGQMLQQLPRLEDVTANRMSVCAMRSKAYLGKCCSDRHRACSCHSKQNGSVYNQEQSLLEQMLQQQSQRMQLPLLQQ